MLPLGTVHCHTQYFLESFPCRLLTSLKWTLGLFWDIAIWQFSHIFQLKINLLQISSLTKCSSEYAVTINSHGFINGGWHMFHCNTEIFHYFLFNSLCDVQCLILAVHWHAEYLCKCITLEILRTVSKTQLFLFQRSQVTHKVHLLTCHSFVFYPLTDLRLGSRSYGPDAPRP
jgi:hypothetical protein